MPDIFPESRDEAILLSMINGEEYTGFPESRIEVLLLQLKATLEDWKSKTKGAYVFHGSVEFSELPSTLTEDMVGWTYNMLEEFTTDDRFVDGAGKVYPAGTNVVIANVGTDETPVLKFDVTSAFVDVNAIYSAIDNIADMIADEFDEDEAYAVGDIVWYVDDLYTFVSPHTAGDPWSNLEVNMTTVDEIINAVYADINNTISDIEGMIANQFNAATAYSEDDYVIYQNGLYKFTSDHEAGAAWDPSIVSSIDVMTAIKQAESDLATLSGYFAAMTDTVSDLEDQVDMIQDAISEEKTVSGNPITVTDALPYPAVSVSAEIEAIQDLHGYDYPWVGGAGKNKLPMTVASVKAANTWGTWNGNIYTIQGGQIEILTDSDGNITGFKVIGTFTQTAWFGIPFTIAANTYVLNGCPASGTFDTYSATIRDAIGGNNISGINDDRGTGSTFTISETLSAYYNIRINSGYACPSGGLTFCPMIRLSTESDATFAPYSNICPISGRTAVTITDVDAESQTASVTVAFEDEHGDPITVYGGSLNLTTGVMTVTDVHVDMGSLSWAYDSTFYAYPEGITECTQTGIPSDIMCSCYEVKNSGYSGTYPNDDNIIYRGTSNTLKMVRVKATAYNGDTTAFKTGVTGQDLIYKLATPTTIQLTPEQLTMLKGYNRLSSDGGGDITLTYKANKVDSVQAEVDVLEANKAEKTTIAPVENGTKASKAYAVGEHFIRGDKFCTAIASIASGAAFTLGTNYTEGSVADSVTQYSNVYIETKSSVSTTADFLADALEKLNNLLSGKPNGKTASGNFRWMGHANFGFNAVMTTEGIVFMAYSSNKMISGVYANNTVTFVSYIGS